MIDREVAVKLLPVAVSQDPVALQRFLGEARAAGRLSHPNTIAVYDIGEADGVHYIVMELARGGCVADLVNGQKRPAFREACRVIIEAARGLAAAHKVGLIHRDIKPENLLWPRTAR
jgi:serine/threonine protein kinase